MIKNYRQFLDESLLENLVLESKLVLSNSLTDLLTKVPNRLAKVFLSLRINDIEKLAQNYIDIGKVQDEVTFIQSKKADTIAQDLIYTVVDDGKYLTHNERNADIFKKLNYIPKGTEPYVPEEGVNGKVITEAPSSRYPDRMYCVFVSDEGRETVLNKAALKISDDIEEKIWNKNRSPIKIGRLLRAILTASNVEFTAKDIEEFVNSYKSTYDIVNDAFSKFELVKGKLIQKWYEEQNYENEESGSLGGSCMKDVPGTYLEIYSENKNCSLLIMYSDAQESKPTYVDGKLTSLKIKGRALVWNTLEGDTFMDRIYTNKDSDVKVFKEYAWKQGWFCKEDQKTSATFMVTNGSIRKSPVYIIQLDKSEFSRYPYIDSLSYLNANRKLLSNRTRSISKPGESVYELDSTGGGRYSIDVDVDDDDDDN